MKVMAPQVEKEEVEVDEAMSSYDRNRKRAAQRAAERNAARCWKDWCSSKKVMYLLERREKLGHVEFR